jgi:hypothetical protein
MTPEMQNMIQQAQQANEHALFQAKLLGYSTYAAICICAVFSILIFWKLCQIQKLLATNSLLQTASQPVNPFTDSEARIAAGNPPLSSIPRTSKDERYMPKSS